tara:strand:- start:74 stop:448 length:375 start_codon:yes stop_codon:yes gene_type:complete
MKVRNYRLEHKVVNPETKIGQGKGGGNMYAVLDNVVQLVEIERGGGLTDSQQAELSKVVKELKSFTEDELTYYLIKDVKGFTKRHHIWLAWFVDADFLMHRTPKKYNCRIMTLLRAGIAGLTKS